LHHRRGESAAHNAGSGRRFLKRERNVPRAFMTTAMPFARPQPVHEQTRVDVAPGEIVERHPREN